MSNDVVMYESKVSPWPVAFDRLLGHQDCEKYRWKKPIFHYGVWIFFLLFTGVKHDYNKHLRLNASLKGQKVLLYQENHVENVKQYFLQKCFIDDEWVNTFLTFSICIMHKIRYNNNILALNFNKSWKKRTKFSHLQFI